MMCFALSGEEEAGEGGAERKKKNQSAKTRQEEERESGQDEEREMTTSSASVWTSCVSETEASFCQSEKQPITADLCLNERVQNFINTKLYSW